MLNKLNLQKGVFHADADAAFDAEEIRRGVKIKIKQTAIELTWILIGSWKILRSSSAAS